MNKYQEAFDEIKNVVVFNKNFNYYANYLKVVQELVDKETPMKPKLKENDVWQSSMYCKNCESFVGTKHLEYTHQNYCTGCGQRIYWSDEE